MKRPVWFVDAFTSQPFHGNPAGVVPEAEGLTSEQMQQIARELHASETAFVLPVDTPDADFQLRFFTPEEEVDLCGHATIGAVCGLVAEGGLSLQDGQGSCTIVTAVGSLPVRYGLEEGLIWAEMRQAEPQFRDVDLDLDLVANLLGISKYDVDQKLIAGLSYTGLWDLFVPLTSRSVMADMTPSLAALADFNRQLGVASTHVYCTDTVDPNHHFHTRDFSPALGIAEDPATGTATGALTALLHRQGFIEPQQTYLFEQGYEIHRPSVIAARIQTSASGPVHVYVKGTAVRSLIGHLQF